MLEGIESAARQAGASVSFARGVGRHDSTVVVVAASALSHRTAAEETIAGLDGEYFNSVDLSGEAALNRVDSHIDFSWTLYGPTQQMARDWYSVRWTGRITAPASGITRLGVRGKEGYRLWLGDSLLIDKWHKRSAGETTVAVDIAPHHSHDIRLEFHETTGNGRVALVWQTGDAPIYQMAIDSAVAVARDADVAIVVAGIEEGEFRDRASLRLPGHQEQMIRAVAATGTPVVVVLVGGSAVTSREWIDSVAAVLVAWYPGDAGGDAVADVLFGRSNPAGRLPMTWPVSEGQLPLVYNHKPTGRGDDYLDLTGEPDFPFGHGLSYTTFEYSDLRITPDTVTPGDTAQVTFQVRNTGDRSGDEVVQLYVNDLLASVARPVLELKAFARVRNIAPGESRQVTLELPVNRLAFLDQALEWTVEPGDFRLLVGGSSRDLRLRGTLTVGAVP